MSITRRGSVIDSLAIAPDSGGMITPGQTLSNPVTGERFSFIDTAATTGGELLSFELGLRPGGAVPITHVHPIQTERFEVPAGPRHGFANDGDGEARVRVDVRPALAMEDMFADIIAMARDGRMTRRGMPRNLFDLALLARTYDRESHAPLIGARSARRARPRAAPAPHADARNDRMSTSPIL